MTTAQHTPDPPVPDLAGSDAVAGPVEERLTYPEAVRRRSWWRALVAIAGVVVTIAVGQVFPFLGGWLELVFPSLGGGLLLGPVAFLGLNLSLVLLVPASLLLSKWLYGSATDLLSVLGRIRWGLMARAAAIVVPVWTLFLGTALLLGVTPPSPVVWALLAISIVTTPLQAAGEEMAFRGLLFRATSTWARGRLGVLVGLAVSSLLFALAHLVTDPWMFSYFFVFGLSMAIMAWRTGGLEVNIVVHAWHNTLSMVVGLLTVGSIDALLTRNDVNPGPAMLVYDVVFLTAAGITWLISSRSRRVRTVSPDAWR